MPRIDEFVIHRSGQPDLIPTTSQMSISSMPSIMRVRSAGDATANDLNILPAEPNKAYLIHGYSLYGQNAVGTWGNFVALGMTDFYTGEYILIDGINIATNVADIQRSRITGLNVLTHPGKPVVITTSGAPAPYWKSCIIYFSEVVY